MKKDKLIFDKNVESYDKYRPRYCQELYDKIISYSNINRSSKVVEVGCGTGQATEAFLKTGCSLCAVEPGENLSKYTQYKYRNYCNLSVENIKFEDYSIEANSIDLIYSATAFHWIDECIGYKKAYDSLKEGGIIALFWNRPFVNKKDDPLHVRIQEIYKKYGETYEEPVEANESTYTVRKNTILKYGFKDCKFYLFHNIRVFNADEYIELLNTYSDHSASLGENKMLFEKEVKDAICAYGGKIKLYDTIDLYMGQK